MPVKPRILQTTIAGSLPKPAWLAEPVKSRPASFAPSAQAPR
jgi:hypothetical protein